MGSRRAIVKCMINQAFELPRPDIAKYLYGVIDTLVLPSDKIAPVDQKLKAKQREKLNTLLKAESKLEGPEVIRNNIIRAFEACFVVVDYVRLHLAEDIRLFDMERLNFEYADEVVGVDDDEARTLLVYRNVMMTALTSIPDANHKGMLVDICIRLSEDAGAPAKYSWGGRGQTDESTRREIIFERECGRDAKQCRVMYAAHKALKAGAVANKCVGATKKAPAVLSVTATPLKRPHAPASHLETMSVTDNDAKRQRGASDGMANVPPVLPLVRTATLPAAIRTLQNDGGGSDVEERLAPAAIGGWEAGGFMPGPVRCEAESYVLQRAVVDHGTQPPAAVALEPWVRDFLDYMQDCDWC
jgi:tellurite resistance protein